MSGPPVMPDGRYLVVRGRLWRRANPHLTPERRQALVDELMRARRAVGRALRSDDASALADARARVEAAKRGLGERGPVWWDDGAPDLNRRMARNTSYADWWAAACPHGEGLGVGVQGAERRREISSTPARTAHSGPSTVGVPASDPPMPVAAGMGGSAPKSGAPDLGEEGEEAHAASRPARASPRATRERR